MKDGMDMDKQILVQIPKHQFPLFLSPETLEVLHRMGTVTMNPNHRPFTKQELMRYIKNTNVCITTWGSQPITEEVLKEAEHLEVVAHMAGSVKPYVCKDVFDYNVTVIHGGHAIAQSVAESVLALVLGWYHNIIQVNTMMRGGAAWGKSRLESDELRGKTFGLIGFGTVAREVVHLLRSFELKFIAYDPYLPQETADDFGVKLMPFHDVIRHSNVLSLHTPKIPDTFHMFGEKELALIPDGSLLINTARGDILDEVALIKELKKNRFNAALDVFSEEPLSLSSELRKLDNVLLRPHIAGVNPNTRLRIGKSVTEDIRKHYSGEGACYRLTYAEMQRMT